MKAINNIRLIPHTNKVPFGYRKVRKVASIKKNPLKNKRVMSRLNPYAIAEKAAARNVIEQRKRARQAKLDAKRGVR